MKGTMNRVFSEQAPTYYEAERKAKEKYGEPLTILMHETVKIPGGFLNLFSQEGVKITGIIPTLNRGIRSQISSPLGKATIQKDLTRGVGIPTVLPTVQVPTAQKNASENLYQENSLFAEEKEKILALAGVGKDTALKEVLTEVKALKEKIENQGYASSQEEHPTLNRIDDLLILNDFPVSYRKTMLARMRKEISIDGLNNFFAVQDKVLEWIGESIKIYETETFKLRPRIMILVGPTGVGKTTTLAKLAANFGINEKGRHKRRIVLVTIDAYRIGAKEQLEKYSEWMEFPFFPVVDYDELKKIIAMNSEGTDLFLIDTIGKNPRDMVQLGEMKQLLDACGRLAEIHLAVAATTKSSDFIEILQQFESFNYKSVIVTKIDETVRTGNVIGALSEKAKPVSYITDGQTVPTDIRKASIVQFLINLEGFKVNRIKLEEMFPDKGQEQMQQWR